MSLTLSRADSIQSAVSPPSLPKPHHYLSRPKASDVPPVSIPFKAASETVRLTFFSVSLVASIALFSFLDVEDTALEATTPTVGAVVLTGASCGDSRDARVNFVKDDMVVQQVAISN